MGIKEARAWKTMAPKKCSNSISDGEDSKIMEFPVFQFGQLWGPDTHSLGKHLHRAMQMGKPGGLSPLPRSLTRPAGQQLAFLLHNLHCIGISSSAPVFLHRLWCPAGHRPLFLPLNPQHSAWYPIGTQ